MIMVSYIIIVTVTIVTRSRLIPSNICSIPLASFLPSEPPSMVSVYVLSRNELRWNGLMLRSVKIFKISTITILKSLETSDQDYQAVLFERSAFVIGAIWGYWDHASAGIP